MKRTLGFISVLLLCLLLFLCINVKLGLELRVMRVLEYSDFYFDPFWLPLLLSRSTLKAYILSCHSLFLCKVVVPSVILPFLDFAVLPLLPELHYLNRWSPRQILFQHHCGLLWGGSSLVKLMTCVLLQGLLLLAALGWCTVSVFMNCLCCLVMVPHLRTQVVFYCPWRLFLLPLPVSASWIATSFPFHNVADKIAFLGTKE